MSWSSVQFSHWRYRLIWNWGVGDLKYEFISWNLGGGKVSQIWGLGGCQNFPRLIGPS